jgi:O-antigen ligase
LRERIAPVKQGQWLNLLAAILVFAIFVQLADPLQAIGSQLTATIVTVGVAAGCWLPFTVAWWRSRRRAFFVGPVIAWALAYGLAIGLSVVFAESRGTPLKSLVLYGRDLLLVFMISAFITTWSGMRAVMWAMIAGGCVLCLLAFANLATGLTFGGLAHAWTRVPVGGGNLGVRLAGPDCEPNIFAQQLVVVIAFALCMVSIERRPVARILAVGAAVLMSWTFFLTLSRGGFVGLLAALVCIALLRPRMRTRTALRVGATVLVVLVVGVPAGYWQRLETTVTYLVGASDGDPSLQARTVYWRVAALMARDHPLTGVGQGNYEVMWPRYRAQVDPGLPFEAQGAQMILAHIAAETGIPGVVTLVGVVVAATRSVRRARQGASAQGDADAALMAGALEAALYGYVAASLFLDGGGARDFWLLVSLAAAAGQLASPGSRQPDEDQAVRARTLVELAPTLDRV